jgi:regulator of sigma E protease
MDIHIWFGTIVVLGILIFVHELGHFLVAKWCKVGVLEFALGFGPKLFRFNYGETTYTVRAIPLGGFVRMSGDDPRMMSGDVIAPGEAGGASPIEGSQDLTPAQQRLVADPTRWFLKKAYLPRCAIVLAGPVFNFVFAWVLAASLFFIKGIPTFVDGPVTIGAVVEGLPADTAGIKSGDKLLTVDGTAIGTFEQLVKVVQGSGGKELTFELERTLPVNPELPDVKALPERVVVKVKPTADATELDVLAGRAAFRVGIDPSHERREFEPASFVRAAEAGAEHVYALTAMTVRVLKALVTGILSPTKAIGGPGTILNEIAKSTKAGWTELIMLMIFLNVTLGVMNLLPIPVLDGGHLTLFTLEKLKGGPLSPRFTELATQVGMVLLMLLMVFAVGNDISRFM